MGIKSGLIPTLWRKLTGGPKFGTFEIDAPLYGCTPGAARATRPNPNRTSAGRASSTTNALGAICNASARQPLNGATAGGSDDRATAEGAASTPSTFPGWIVSSNLSLGATLLGESCSGRCRWGQSCSGEGRPCLRRGRPGEVGWGPFRWWQRHR